MKISQMTTDQAADALIRIAPSAANIMHDEDTVATLEKVANGSNNPLVFFADNLVPIANILLKDHRADFYEIVAALSNKTADDVANQKFPETILDVKNCLDGDLVDFFVSLKK